MYMFRKRNLQLANLAWTINILILNIPVDRLSIPIPMVDVVLKPSIGPILRRSRICIRARAGKKNAVIGDAKVLVKNYT